jgi:transposase
MLTKMTDEDWEIVLALFDAAQSERGEPGRDDRKFLEAMHYFTVHSITWRALPAEFGNWNSVWKRFWRLSRSGVQDTRGQENRALGRSRGGFSSKIHLKTHFDGLPIAFHLTGGEVSDTTQLT